MPHQPSRSSLTTVLAALLLAASACDADSKNGAGGTDGGAGGSGGKPAVSGTAPAQCQQFRSALCKRSVECVTGDADPGNDKVETAACETELATVIPCERADTAAPAIATCVSNIQSLTCAGLFPLGQLDLPDACNGTLTFTQSEPEKKCNALMALVCKRLIECGNITDLTQDECAALFSEDLGCFETTAIGPNYDACMSQLGTLSCAVVAPPGSTSLDLPVECDQVLTIGN